MLKQLLSVFLESRCLFCSRPTSKSLCQYCQQKLFSYQLSDNNRLSYWQDLSLFAWGKYEGQLKRAIALMKYQKQPDIGRLLGQLLGNLWLSNGLIKPQQKLTVVPIPLHSSKLNDRGFNQAELIARGFCQITGYSLNPQALIRVRNTAAMFNLSLEERTKNLENAFQVGYKLPKHPVLLLDDIYTVGTTIKESAKILRQQRIEVIGALVVAKSSNQ